LAPIRQRGGIDYTGILGEGLARPQVITGEIDEAINGVDLILICVPACGHEYYARLLAPRLLPGSLVVLNPGHTGGSLHFAHLLQEHNRDHGVIVGETDTLTYGCRLVAPAKLWLYRLKPGISYATFPGKHIQVTRQRLVEIYPTITSASSVLETGLMNPNAMLHPAGMLLNVGWIEYSGGAFRFYSEGITPSVARLMEMMDQERLEIIRSLNEQIELDIPLCSLVQHLHNLEYTSDQALRSGSVYQALQDSEPNRPLKAPTSLQHRYIAEDVPFGLVPLAALGRMVKVDTPTMRLMIRLASLLCDVDYGQTGRTLEKMGLTLVAMDQLEQFLWEGHT
jgi:opine dehydrogenase